MRDDSHQAKRKKSMSNIFSICFENVRKKRKGLYFFIILLLFSAILDSMSNPIVKLFSEPLMAVGFSGTCICLGIKLRCSVVPSQNSRNTKYHLVSTVWILIGIGAIIGYIATKLIPIILR